MTLPPPPPTPPPPPPPGLETLGFERTTPGRRVAAGLITLAFHLVVLLIPLGLVIVSIVLYTDDRIGGEWIAGAAATLAIGLILSFLHDIVYVGRYSATIGHRTLGCKLVEYETGQPVSYGIAAARFGVEFAANALGVLLLLWLANLIMVFVHDENRHLLDLITNTSLVTDPDR